jgi:anti-sigma regulatory factor (Ser/Thr protein kinase)
VPSHPKYLSVVRAVTARMSDIGGFEDTTTERLKLAVDEACSNVIKYAYGGNTEKKIVVKFRITRKDFVVIIEDNGCKACPESIKGRSLEEIRPGGLGTHFIKRAFDVFRFDEGKKTGNRVLLIKHFEGKA